MDTPNSNSEFFSGKHCPYCHQEIEDSAFDAHLHNHKVENHEISLNLPPLAIDYYQHIINQNNDEEPSSEPKMIPQDPQYNNVYGPPINNNINSTNNNNNISNNNNFNYNFSPPLVVYPSIPPSVNNDNNIPNQNNTSTSNNDIQNNDDKYNCMPPIPLVGNNAPNLPPLNNNDTFHGNYWDGPRPQIGIPPEVHEMFKNGWREITDEEIELIMGRLQAKTLTDKDELKNSHCVICMNDFENGDNITTLPCIHFFHSDCIRNWFKSKNYCPICKYEISLKNLNN